MFAAAAIVVVLAGVLAWQTIGDESAPTPEPSGLEQEIQPELNDGVLSESELQAARASYQEIINDVPFWIGLRAAADFTDAEIRSLAQVACEQAVAADSSMAYLAGVRAAVSQDASRTTMAGTAGVALCQADLQPYMAQLDAVERFVSPQP